jgi:cytochrome d ubiquinol oxidase subunit II
MINFANHIDLPMVWSGILALAIFLYVALDGFDLGVGILLPFAPTEECRETMMNSVAPFWNGNETWLILGGGGLFAAFPLAYSIIIPALYIPLIFSLLGLIFRGVAFEFWFKGKANVKKLWGYLFHFGSLAAGFFQGVMLGTFVQGFPVNGQIYVGNNFEWLTAFSLMTGVAVVFGYALLGSTWLIMKTEERTQLWARKVAEYVLLYVILFMGLVSLWMPLINEHVKQFWFSLPNFIYLSPIPLFTCISFIMLFRSIVNNQEKAPFFWSLGLFLLGYLGLAFSIYPYVVPYKILLREAAAAPESQSLLLLGTVITLPFILGYTAFSYYVFRGKTKNATTYH